MSHASDARQDAPRPQELQLDLPGDARRTYPNGLMPVPRRYRTRLRTVLMVLLVMSMVISPILAAAGELHGVQHAVEAVDGGAHGHAHAAADDHHGHPGHDGVETDPDHATGVHSLLHQAGSMSVALPEVPALLTPPLVATRLPEVTRCHLPGDSPTHPFRPPIA